MKPLAVARVVSSTRSHLLLWYKERVAEVSLLPHSQSDFPAVNDYATTGPLDVRRLAGCCFHENVFDTDWSSEGTADAEKESRLGRAAAGLSLDRLRPHFRSNDNICARIP